MFSRPILCFVTWQQQVNVIFLIVNEFQYWIQIVESKHAYLKISEWEFLKETEKERVGEDRRTVFLIFKYTYGHTSFYTEGSKLLNVGKVRVIKFNPNIKCYGSNMSMLPFLTV